ncbi:MAG: hypothetical protein M3N54_08160 [Acidobacteriota bacterium]|nr:hypothetical protein [Acidobacteriota bacterium]
MAQVGKGMQSQEVSYRRRLINLNIERGKLLRKFIRAIRCDAPAPDDNGEGVQYFSGLQ